MQDKIIVINFENGKAYLSKSKFLFYRDLGIPANSNRCVSKAAWTIRVLNYNISNKQIFAEILSYNTFNISFPSHQLLMNNELDVVSSIKFRSLDTTNMFLTLCGKNESKTLVVQHETVYDGDGLIQEANYSQGKAKPKIKNEIVSPLPNSDIKDSFLIPLKNIHFKFGCVVFEKKITKLNKVVEFTVENLDIREEFDAIKNYFGKVLKVKKIQFDIHIHLEQGEIKSIETKSQHIEKINQDLIDCVKIEYVKSMSKKKIEVNVDKSIFTMEEFFQMQSDEKINADTFYSNDVQLFEDILKITDTKHYKNLGYLSNRHAHLIMKLRFLIKPFSFIFLIEGEKKYHIIWETLDTKEATYVWHVDKSLNKLKAAMQKVENIINGIKVQGKLSYIKGNEDEYKRIYHDYSNFVEGFVKWKGELESILT